MKETIGWIGTGLMGNPMCKHVINNGYKVFVHTRTKLRAKNLLDAGASWENSPLEVALKSDVVFSIVCGPEDLKEVFFGEKGIIKSKKENLIFVDMTTSLPSLAKNIFEEGEKNKICTLDAPVSGGSFGALDGSLVAMVGG